MIKIGLTDFTPVDKIIEIRDNKEAIKAKYAISATDILKCTLMNEHYIEISFQYNRYAAFKRSDYILWNGSKYTLREDYIPEQVNKRKYDYTLRFEAVEMLFQDIQYYYLNQSLKESEWRLAGNPEYFIKIAVDNANRYFKVTDFQIGVIEPTEIKDIIFDTNTNTFDALTQIAEAYESEWYMTGKTINLVKKVSFGAEVDFETEVSILSMSRSEGENSKKYTRILALGSERNLPKDYRGSSTGESVDAVYPKRLRIPVSKGDVIDAYPNMSPDEVVEGTVIFDEVYPKRIGTIQAVGTIEYTDTDEDTGEVTKWNAFKIKDSGINFKEEYLLPGVELRLSMQSGDLNGFDFALKFHKDGFSSSDNSQYFEIVRSEDYGKKLPNDTMKPKAGDKYVLYGFNIALVSDQYVPAGELELFDTASAWIKKQLQDTSVYDCPTVIDHFKKNGMDLELGQKVKLIKDVASNRNLLTNSSFEAGIANSDVVNGSTIARVSGGFHGEWCMKTVSSNNPSSGYAWNNMPTILGKEYIISCYVKADTPISDCNFGVYTASWTHVKSKGVYIGTEWTRIDIPFTATATNMRMCILKGNATFYVDCLQLQEGNKLTPWNLAPEDISGAIRSSRIMGYEKKLVNKYDATYIVGDNSAYSRLAAIEKDLKELQYAGVVYENTGYGGVYLIKQFDTTTPSDFNAYSAKASDAKYFNKQTGGAVQGDTLFQKNIQVQGTVISDVIQNSTFTSGALLGTGYQFKRDSNGYSYGEIDFFTVRKGFNVSEIIKAEVKSVGGTIILSLADLKSSDVEDRGSYYRVFYDNQEGKLINQFQKDDQALHQTFNGVELKRYWRLVINVGVDFIDLSKADCEVGSKIPAKDELIIQLGNRTNINRQSAQIISSYPTNAISLFEDINSYDLTGKEKTYIKSKRIGGTHIDGTFSISTNGTTAPVYKERQVFANGTVYYLNDRVSYLGSYWVCIVNSTVTTPSETSIAWRKDTAGQTDIDKATNEVRTEYKADFVVLDTKVASKVSQTDFNALGQRVSTSESNITQLSNSITSVVETVENIQVGGRNLITNSSSEFGIGYSGGINGAKTTIYTSDKVEGLNSIKVDTSGISTYDTGYNRYNLDIKKGEYTFSIYTKALAESPASAPFDVRVVLLRQDYTYITTIGTHRVGDDWTRFVKSFTLTSDYSKCRIALMNPNRLFLVDCLQLEEGNKATPWTEAPEDTQLRIQQAQTSADDAQNTANLKNRTYYQDQAPTTPSGGFRIGDLWYKRTLVSSSGAISPDPSNNIYQLQFRWNGSEWMPINWNVSKSKIEQTDSSISMIVEKTGINSVGAGSSLYSMILQTESEIKLEVSKIQIGGVNLLNNSSFEAGIANSDVVNGSTIARVSGGFHGEWCMKTVSSNNPSSGYAWNNMPTILGKEYIISCYVKADTPISDCNFGVYTASWTHVKSKGVYIGTEWTRIDIPFTATATNMRMCILKGNATFYVDCLQLQEGNKLTPWNISKEDTKDEIIDEVKAGLVVTAEGINIFGETFTVNSLMIAKAIEAQSLNVGGNMTISQNGTITIANGKIILNADGSGRLANGNIVWDANGNVTVLGKFETDRNGNRIIIDPNLNSIRMINSLNGKSCEVLNIGWEDVGFGILRPTILMKEYSDDGSSVRGSIIVSPFTFGMYRDGRSDLPFIEVAGGWTSKRIKLSDYSLPSSRPSVKGTLWRDGEVLKIVT